MTMLVYFGTTRGLETLQIPIGLVSPQDIDLPDAWIEISDSFGKLLSESPIFLFFRRTVNGIQCSWIGVYMSVNEIGYQRAGGFYGAGLWFSGAPVNGQEVLSHLMRAAETLRGGAIERGAFQKRIAEVAAILRPTVDPFRTLFIGTSSTSGGCFPAERESLAFIGVEGTGVVEVFEWAQRSSSASAFSKVIFGPPAQRPEGGRIVQDRIFRSLALAIEFAHRVKLAVFTDQIGHLEMQSRQTETSNRGLLEKCRSLEQRSQDLERRNQDLERRNQDLEDRSRVLEHRLQPLYKPQFQNSGNLPTRTPVNLARGEPPRTTIADAEVSASRPVGSYQGYDDLGVSASPAKSSSVKLGSILIILIVVFLILLVVVFIISTLLA